MNFAKFTHFAIILTAALGSIVVAQDKGSSILDFGKLNPNAQLSPTSNDGSNVSLSGQFEIYEGTAKGKLSISAKIEEGWHIYSITQPPGGPKASILKLTESDEFKVTGPFVASPSPHIIPPDVFPVPSEEHEGVVTWTAPIELADGVDPKQLEISTTYKGQVCSRQCIDVGPTTVAAQFAGFIAGTPEAEDSASGAFKVDRSHATIRGHIEPSTVKPGGKVRLILSATSEEGYHVYAYADKKEEGAISAPTVIGFTKLNDWSANRPVASGKPIEKESGLKDEPVLRYHEGTVSWTVEIAIPEDAESGKYSLDGVIGLQTCTDRTCDGPRAAAFTVVVTVDADPNEKKSLVAFTSASYSKALKAAEAMNWAGEPKGDAPQLKLGSGATGGESTTSASTSIYIILPMAFAAGFILNFMPCVLPVVGLKIMAFVQQAGESRSRILTLNIVYTLGMLSVFLALAMLSVLFGLGWGSQFTSATFNIVLASVVFAFALSFLGVWEIPLPGFASGGKVGELAQEEGLTGAFFKGILTTVLATPCAGPMLIPALTAAAAWPAPIVFAAYTCVGLGMAFPYLVIGASPNLVSFLPKPGPWMDTFKHIMGFVLLGTVVMLMTFVAPQYHVPMIAFMIGLWAAFWWLGRTSFYESFSKWTGAFVQGGLFAAIIGVIAFKGLLPEMETRLNRRIRHEIARLGGDVDKLTHNESGNELPWKPYKYEFLEQLVKEEKTVFIDFTGDS